MKDVPAFRLRPYREEDEEAALHLWQAAWQLTCPAIDFAARLPWWRQRWRHEVLPVSEVTLAVDDSNAPIGFLVFTPATDFMDQLVVAPAWWGKGVAGKLLDYCKKRATSKIVLDVNQDNVRAISFYEKAGFRRLSEDVNKHSGRPTYWYVWVAGRQKPEA